MGGLQLVADEPRDFGCRVPALMWIEGRGRSSGLPVGAPLGGALRVPATGSVTPENICRGVRDLRVGTQLAR